MTSPFLTQIPGIDSEEMLYLEHLTKDLNTEQLNNFILIYNTKRKSQDNMLLFAVLGLVVVPGLQRFIVGQIGMGLLYLFTLGLCFIGSIIDLINYKKLGYEYNQKVALEALTMSGSRI